VLNTFFTFGQSGVVEQGASLLQLKDSKQFNEQILVRAAKHSEENDRISEAIKLYNLAEDYSTVISCLAQSLGNTISQPSPDGKARALEKTAAEVLRHYERMNRAVGKDRDAVVRLLRIREAMDAKNAGRPEVALDVGFSLDTDELFAHTLRPGHGINGSDSSQRRRCKNHPASRRIQRSARIFAA
jgi:nuclear pore complex protein Nup93